MQDNQEACEQRTIDVGSADGEPRTADTVAVESTESINLALREHQRQVDGWYLQSVTKDLNTWAGRMVDEFKLEIGLPCINIEKLRRPKLGHYRCGRNGFGLIDEIAIDLQHVLGHDYWTVLATLLHELLHSFQEHNGQPASKKSGNYHNAEFRKKAARLGLVVDEHGHTECEPGDTPFLNLLRKHGVEAPVVEVPKMPARHGKGNSKLSLYVCPCGVRLRVGRSRINALCLDCKGVFVKQA